jgi:integrase
VAEKKSRSLVKQARTYLKAAFREALEADLIRKDPSATVKLPDGLRKPEETVFDLEQVGKFLNSLSDRDHLIVRLFALGAFRPGELAALRREDYDGRVLKVDEVLRRVDLKVEGKDKPVLGYRVCPGAKTEDSVRKVVVPADLRMELEGWIAKHTLEPRDFLFHSSRGTPLNLTNLLRRSMKKRAEAAGLTGFTWRAMRRSFATLLHDVPGTSIKDAQGQLGHAYASRTTLDVYTKELIESREEAIEKLDEKLRNTGKRKVQ